MTNTDTRDVRATVAQIRQLSAAGCEIVRLAVPDMEAARALRLIRGLTIMPLVADVHFDHRLALAALAAGADKLRINPGNIGSQAKVREVVKAAKGRGVPIRIGVNAGSLEKDILSKHGRPTARGMAESALRHAGILEKLGFDDIVVSLKGSDVPMTIAACRLFSAKSDHPLHLGITEAGTAFAGAVRSAVGLGALLAEGIGDTVRVSLAGDPSEEVRAAKIILQALGLRRFGPTVIACPTCGRCRIDVAGIADQVERGLSRLAAPLTVAVMGCAVNGPGEAREADLGIAGGNREGLLFMKGKIIGRVPEGAMAERLLKEAFRLAGPAAPGRGEKNSN
jgi:(E)-4-hydroxy-3-methylbut-2-enyl-diphosphate synthase